MTRDPESRTTAKGTTVVQFGLARNEKYGESEKTIFVDVVAFGRLAEVLAEHYVPRNIMLVMFPSPLCA